jgi:arabinofuranosyltransferase
MASPPSRRPRTALAACAVLTVFFVANAYVCDDAFFSFRSVDNLVRGFGLRWNVAERVQVFTNPLLTLLTSAAYWFTHDPSSVPNPGRLYWTILAISYGLSLVSVLCLALRLGASSWFWAFFALLMSSQAFATFTSSGLETPLTYLFVALFYLRYLEEEPQTRADLLWLWSIAALAVVSRIDSGLVFVFPFLDTVWRAMRRLGPRIVPTLMLASAPIFLWFGFALAYFGFLLPNTYYAKLGLDAAPGAIASMGASFLGLSALEDPLTLLTITAAVVVALAAGDRRSRFTAASIVACIFYVFAIGGDNIGFRMLAPPFLAAAMLLHRHVRVRRPHPSGRLRGSVLAMLLLYGLLIPSSPMRVLFDGPSSFHVRYFYAASNPLYGLRGGGFPFGAYPGVATPEECRALRTQSFEASISGGGLAGFCRGPHHHLVMPFGITDPLVSRLPIRVEEPFLPGHVPKALPSGYLETVRTGENRIEDPSLAAYYDKIHRITRAPLLDHERWGDILELNLSSAARYREPYVAEGSTGKKRLGPPSLPERLRARRGSPDR